MSDEFQGKVAFITGGGSGIGKAVALSLGAQGARVAVCDRAVAQAEAVAADIRAAGGEALAIAADVSVEAEVEAALALVVEHFGGLDLAVNNAGIASCDLPLVEQSLEQFERVIGVNLKGVWLCLRREMALMIAGGGGSIVNTASALGLTALPNGSEYIAAKHGVVGLTKAAATEVSAKGVRVNAVCPGVIETPLTHHATTDPEYGVALKALHPIGRIGHAQEIADAILWLLSPRSSFVTGAAVPVDGGWTI